jgi:IS5 family transposase
MARLLEQVEPLKASLRAKVVHPFYVTKNLFRHKKVGYKVLAKNTAQLFILLDLANPMIAKRSLLTIHARDAS